MVRFLFSANWSTACISQRVGVVLKIQLQAHAPIPPVSPSYDRGRGARRMGSPNSSACHDDRRKPPDGTTPPDPDSQNPLAENIAQMTEGLTHDVRALPLENTFSL
jgi:hypothetical protein